MFIKWIREEKDLQTSKHLYLKILWTDDFIVYFYILIFAFPDQETSQVGTKSNLGIYRLPSSDNNINTKKTVRISRSDEWKSLKPDLNITQVGINLLQFTVRIHCYWSSTHGHRLNHLRILNWFLNTNYWSDQFHNRVLVITLSGCSQKVPT